MSEIDRDTIYRARVNLETSRIEWKELLRFFASGAAIFVSPQLDLVEVAFQISEDNTEQVSQWLSSGEVAQVTDAQAQEWIDCDAEMWAVVVSPWVLVQPITA